MRKMIPQLLVQHIVGVQPMQTPGEPFCESCYVAAVRCSDDPEHSWECPLCKRQDLGGRLWFLVRNLQTLVEARSRVFENLMPNIDNPAARVRRPFMYEDNPLDPNDRYRDWLTEHVGAQGSDWNWVLTTLEDRGTLEIEFAQEEDAVLFELTFV